MTNRKFLSVLVPGLLLALTFLLAGCSEDSPIAPGEQMGAAGDLGPLSGEFDQEFAEAIDKGVMIVVQDGSEIPSEIATVADAVSFWPYTGTSLSEVTVDPINLVFRGQASPLQIRQALMSLDGNRTVEYPGLPTFPNMAPFNLQWTDAVGGDVQTTYISEGGWEGCVIQLTLGEYSGLRVHLRLFGTSVDDGDQGTWTLGGAHFEMMIPGTSEHQVLSWEWAQGVVVYDLVRSGLLGAAPESTGPINAAGTYREIPAFMIDALLNDPAGVQLLAALGYDAQSGQPYPLPSDGQGTLLTLAGSVPIEPGTFTNTVVIEYGQAIPRPVCSDGPYDWLYVTGPVTFVSEVEVTANGRYHYRNIYDGVLQAVPINIETFEPIGLPFEAQVKGRQNGQTGPNLRKVTNGDKRLALQEGGAELLTETLKVGTVGNLSHRSFERCFDPE